MTSPVSTFPDRQPEPSPAIGSLQKQVAHVPLPKRLALIAMRRRGVILGALGAAVLLGLIVTLLTTPRYTATTRIEISREGNRVAPVQGVEREATAADLEFYQTQYGLLRSESLAKAVVNDLKLAENPEFFRSFGVDTDKLFGEGANRNSAAARDRRVRAAAAVLLKNLAVSPLRNSRLVDISFVGPDPVLATKIANSWAESFIETNLSRRFDANSYARKFLETRLEELRRRLEDSERDLVKYADQQNIINVPGSVDRQTGQTTGERPLLSDELTRLNDELSAAVAARIAAEAQLPQSRGGANQLALNNNAINGLREKRAELAGEYAKLMVQFRPDYPAARSLASQISNLDASIAREESRVNQSFDTNYRASLEREAGLRKRVEALKSGVTDLRRRSIQYNIYQRESDTNRQLYDALLQRYKEIGVAGGIGTNNIAVIDVASVPERPSRPDMKINLLVAVLLGLIAGVGVAWLLEQIEEGISDPTDVSAALDVPLIGTVPTSEGNLLEALENPRSPIVEAYLAIQANLELATSSGVPQAIAVTSTQPKEGKSTTSYAIAHSLARTHRSVVLVDADMRSPMVHQEFGLSNTLGLSNLLSGNDNLAAALQVSSRPGLTILTAGPSPLNAADLLSGNRLKEIVERLRDQFDHVVIDCPPVMGLADAPLIASVADGVVYVIRSRVIRSSLVRLALQRLAGARAEVLGVVLTRFEPKHSRYGFGYDYGYGYGRD